MVCGFFLLIQVWPFFKKKLKDSKAMYNFTTSKGQSFRPKFRPI